MRKQGKWLVNFIILVIIIGVLYSVHSCLSPGKDISKTTDKVGNDLPFLPKIGSKLTLNTVKKNGNEYLIRYNGSKWLTITQGEPFPNNNSKNELIGVKYSATINNSFLVRTDNTIGHRKWLNKEKNVLQSYNYVIYIKQNPTKKSWAQNPHDLLP